MLVGGVWFSVAGILEEFELSPDLDRAVLIGLEASEEYLGHDPVPTTIHVRTTPDQVDDVMAVLAASANPENPEEVEVARCVHGAVSGPRCCGAPGRGRRHRKRDGDLGAGA